eukprot:c21868_g1_i4 orf=308-1789(+)
MMAAVLNWFKNVQNDESEIGENAVTSLVPVHFEVKDNIAFKQFGVFVELVEESECSANILTCLLGKVLETQMIDDIRIVGNILTDIARISVDAANQLCKCGIVCAIKNFLTLSDSRLSTATSTLIELLFQLLSSVHLMESADEESWLVIANQSVYKLLAQLTDNSNPICRRETVQLLNLVSLIMHKATVVLGFLTEASMALLLNSQLHKTIDAHITQAAAQGSKVSECGLGICEGRDLCYFLVFYLLFLRCAMTHMQACIHPQVIPSHESSQKNAGEKMKNFYDYISDLLHKSYTQVENLSRILYYGHTLLKILASSCLLEIFYWFAEGKSMLHGSEISGRYQFSSTEIQSVIMVLQGSVFDSNILVQRNTVYCLFWLISNSCLSACEQKAVLGSSWYRFIVEELLLFLSTQDPSFGFLNSNAVYIVVALLRVSPLDWMRSVFNSVSLTTIILNLSPQRITSGLVLLFKEFLHAGYLESNHIKKLHELFQECL